MTLWEKVTGRVSSVMLLYESQPFIVHKKSDNLIASPSENPLGNRKSIAFSPCMISADKLLLSH
jgi:hypothetical protein